MLAIIKNLRQTIAEWWAEFTLQTKLLAAATLFVSLIMSGVTFWAVNSIQQDTRMNDTRFGRDLGLLLAANVAPLIAEKDLAQAARFSHRFYSTTSSIRYMLYADENGQIFLGIPFSESQVQNSLTIQRRINLPENFEDSAELPMVRQHITPDGEITDVFVPLHHEGRYLGVLAIGINPNARVVASSNLTRDVTIAVFISIWVMVILGAVFNALMITQPIKELLVGVKNIAAGNFKQRIDLPLRGELGELIASFNEMGERLERYEEQNIEELTAEKAKLETLVSTIADGAVLIDTSLNVILVNPTARRIFGWESQDIIGQNVLKILPAPVQVEITRPLYQIAAGEGHGYQSKSSNIASPLDAEVERHGDRDRGEFRITLTQPTERTIRILLTTVLDQYRDIVKGVAMTVQDITREVELNEAKGQFISNISHELRTPLFNIKSFIETLHDYGDDLSSAERAEFLDTANRETDRLTRLVNDVLDLSRLESSRVYNLEAVELIQPIEQTLRTYQLNARDKGIELIKDVEPDLPPILGHYDLLLQVLTNLVGNGLKFTSSGGKVAIRAYAIAHNTVPETATTEVEAESPNQTSQFVRVEIADTGIGIATEDRQAIFDRFFRVENRVHTLEGTGLGLSIVRNIIEQKHHSRVNLVSEIAVGTTFWFDLVVYQKPEPKPTKNTEVLSPQDANVLVIET
ncbi:two-component system sensor histidine kinase NblS [Merismopedia glauca]|uniref:histidine kinase n=1 Tax=Merismopedia glauca CCAP 1448/3 TaxID=1296344 RepID=A0A2T1C3F3_9CYAN|nr:ATP-binding protein [Merismopedia glauca]PSB02708.1 PAS domain-containing sensor histidine kinase [Merismopedia glauca CCAP 1448/3]